MERIERRGEQTARAPANILRHTVALLDLGDAFSLDYVNDFFVEMALGMQRSSRGDLADIDAGNPLEPAQLQVRAITGQAFPMLERNVADIGDTKALDDWHALLVHPTLVIGFRSWPRCANFNDLGIHILSISFSAFRPFPSISPYRSPGNAGRRTVPVVRAAN